MRGEHFVGGVEFFGGSQRAFRSEQPTRRGQGSRVEARKFPRDGLVGERQGVRRGNCQLQKAAGVPSVINIGHWKLWKTRELLKLN